MIGFPSLWKLLVGSGASSGAAAAGRALKAVSASPLARNVAATRARRDLATCLIHPPWLSVSGSTAKEESLVLCNTVKHCNYEWVVAIAMNKCLHLVRN